MNDRSQVDKNNVPVPPLNDAPLVRSFAGVANTPAPNNEPEPCDRCDGTGWGLYSEECVLCDGVIGSVIKFTGRTHQDAINAWNERAEHGTP